MAGLTELEAVNEILDAINLQGATAIPTSDDGSEEWQASLQLAKSNRTIQGAGWAFNTDRDVTLTPTAGEVLLGAAILRFEAEDDEKYIERPAGKVYDLDNQTNSISNNVTARKLVTLLAFTEVPEKLQQYIVAHARWKFHPRRMDGQRYQTLRAELNDARGEAYADDARASRANPLRTARHARLLGRDRTLGVGGL